MARYQTNTLDPTTMDRELLNYAYLCGQFKIKHKSRTETAPFLIEDLTDNDKLLEAAYAYLDAYTGTLDFLKDLQRRVAAQLPLTAAQATGVLNLLMRDARQRVEDKRAILRPPFAKVLSTDGHTVKPDIKRLVPGTTEFDARYAELFGEG